MSADTEHIAMQGSTVDYCDRWPEEGHNWSSTLHAGQPGQRIVTRQCGSRGYLDASEAAKAVASAHAEGVRAGWEQAAATTSDTDRFWRDNEKHPRIWDPVSLPRIAAEWLASLTPTTEEAKSNG